MNYELKWNMNLGLHCRENKSVYMFLIRIIQEKVIGWLQSMIPKQKLYLIAFIKCPQGQD